MPDPLASPPVHPLDVAHPPIVLDAPDTAPRDPPEGRGIYISKYLALFPRPSRHGARPTVPWPGQPEELAGSRVRTPEE